MRYVLALVFVLALASGGCIAGRGLVDGAAAAATDSSVPKAPAGSGALDWILYTITTAIGYGGVASVRGYIRSKQGDKEA